MKQKFIIVILAVLLIYLFIFDFTGFVWCDYKGLSTDNDRRISELKYDYNFELIIKELQNQPTSYQVKSQPYEYQLADSSRAQGISVDITRTFKSNRYKIRIDHNPGIDRLEIFSDNFSCYQPNGRFFINFIRMVNDLPLSWQQKWELISHFEIDRISTLSIGL